MCGGGQFECIEVQCVFKDGCGGACYYDWLVDVCLCDGQIVVMCGYFDG